MAPPPAKKQKRLAVLSTYEEQDDEENRHASTSKSQARTISSGRVLRKAIGKPSIATLPSRTRVTSKTSAPKGTPTSSSGSTPTSSPAKPIKKPIRSGNLYTFFNAATQTQRVNGAPETSQDTSQIEDEEDLIVDDLSDEELIRSSSTQSGLQRAGHEVMQGQLVNAEAFTRDQQRPAVIHKFLPVPRRSSITACDDVAVAQEADTRPWADKFGPTNLEELAVHKKKVADVRNWLENVINRKDRKRLLVLKGPSGTGKTATISTLARLMDFDIVEWKNPIGSEFSSEGFRSLSAQFGEFLERSGRFNALTLERPSSPPTAVPSPSIFKEPSRRKKTIVLEEFPNTFSRTSSALLSFRSNILQYLAASTPSPGVFFSTQHEPPGEITPLIMIISETLLTSTTAASDSFTAHRLLGADILNHPGTTMIEFNPIAPTLLTKALQLVIQKEARRSGRRRTPGPYVLKRLGEVGDIRSAIGSLEFMCVRGDDSGDWRGRVVATGKIGIKDTSRMTKMEQDSIEMVTQREATLGIFHAVGKVVYNKRDDVPTSDPQMEPPVQPPDHLMHHARPKVSQVNVQGLMDETGTDTPTFIAALHENYVLSCDGPISTDVLIRCIEALSDSDLLSSDRRGGFSTREGSSWGIYQGSDSESLRQNEICFEMAVRGILFALPYPVKRGKVQPTAEGRGSGEGDSFKMFLSHIHEALEAKRRD